MGSGPVVVEIITRRPTAIEPTAPGSVVELELPAGQAIDAVVIQEDIHHGERCRSYALELLRAGEWRAIGRGTCIGHERIHRRDGARCGGALRLVVQESIATPRIRHLSVHAMAR